MEVIQTSLHYPLVPGFAAFREATAPSELPQSRNFCQRVITLALYPTMTEEQVGGLRHTDLWSLLSAFSF
jgi:dTDP-4-amino-4,6-dideoxygalactose transaminase